MLRSRRMRVYTLVRLLYERVIVTVVCVSAYEYIYVIETCVVSIENVRMSVTQYVSSIRARLGHIEIHYYFS